MAVVKLVEENIEDLPVEVEEDLKKAGEKVYVAPPLLLMWWRFRKHRMALICRCGADLLVLCRHFLRIRLAL